MDFMTLAENRYSVRKFKPLPVEREKLELILKAGRIAPTAHNNQPQRILVINDEQALEKLRKCTPCHFNAPLVLLVCYDKTVSWIRKYDDKDHGDIDTSIVCAHMLLQAAELGLGATWVCHFIPEAVRCEFSLPDKLVPVSLLTMGYPAEDAAPNELHFKRKPLEETVFWGSFPETI